jgi:hypothetical protein
MVSIRVCDYRERGGNYVERSRDGGYAGAGTACNLRAGVPEAVTAVRADATEAPNCLPRSSRSSIQRLQRLTDVVHRTRPRAPLRNRRGLLAPWW